MNEKQFSHVKEIFETQREILGLYFTGKDVKVEYLDNGGNLHSINIHPDGTFGTNE